MRGQAPLIRTPEAWALLRALSRRVAEMRGSLEGRGGASTAGAAGGGTIEVSVDAGLPETHAGVSLIVSDDAAYTTSAPLDLEAAQLFDLYVPIASAGDLVIGQIGQSLDGRVATAGGHSHFVTGPEDIVRLHRVRALVDAVVVGAGTVEADDPQLTVRRVEGPGPVRVILDPRGRTSARARVFTDGAAPTIHVLGLEADAGGGSGEPDAGRGASGEPDTGRGASGEPDATGWGASDVTRSGPSAPRGDALPAVEVLRMPVDPDGTIRPEALVARLRERGLRRVLVEGGGVTVSRFLEAGALDRLHVTVAPFVIGSGRQGLSLPPIARLEEAARPPCRHFRMGADILFDLEVGASRGGPSPLDR